MTRRFARGSTTATLVAVLAALVVPLHAAAQEIGEEPDGDTQSEAPTSEVGEQPRDPADDDPTAGAFEVTGLRLPLPDDVDQSGERGLLVWPEGRRVYQFIRAGDATGLAAFDLDTMEEVDRSIFIPDTREPYGDQWSEAAPGYMPVDGAGGRLFIPYSDKGAAPGVADAEGCGDDHTSTQCISGILVVDARTLAVSADLPFLPIDVDGVAVRPALRAMSYWEPEPGTGKLLLQVEAQGVGGSVATLAEGVLTRAGVTYAMQVDPVDGSVDWTSRVPTCNSTSQNPATGQALTAIRNVIIGTHLEDRDPAVYLACYIGTGSTAAVVRLDLDPDDPDAPPAGQVAFRGPAGVVNMLADPVSARILLFVKGQGESLIVFDGARGGYTAALGLGAGGTTAVTLGLDVVDGRLYAISSRGTSNDPPELRSSRFLAGTTRGATLPQLTPVPSLASLVADHQIDGSANRFPLAVDPASTDKPARILVRPGNTNAPDFYYVIEDHRDASAVGGGELIRDLPYTDDVPQVDGATDVAFTGAARGYGVRTLLVGGLMSVASQAGARSAIRGNVFRSEVDLAEDGGGTWNTLQGAPTWGSLLPDYPLADVDGGTNAVGGEACLYRDRELAFGLAGALDVLPDLGPTGSAGQAAAATTDFQTAEDLTTPGRCAEALADLLSGTLSDAGVRQPEPVDLEDVSPAFAEASCVAPSQEPADAADEQGSQISPVSTSYAAVSCDEGQRTAGTGRVRFVDVGPVAVGEASSTFDITRDPGGGLVATMRSIARDVNIGGVVHIDSVESVAISWATGRSQPEETLEDDFNCIYGRTAGTCLQRTLRGVTVGDSFSCHECAFSNEQMLDGMRRALGDGWLVDMPEADEFLADGAPNGALAGVIKKPDQQFADTIMNGDTLPTLPALQLTRINDDIMGRGRQIYQFAGVEMSTSFGILCLLEVIDGECTQRPGALSIELLDLESLPLPGGVFELYRDVEEATDGDESEADADASPTETESEADPSPSETASEDPSADPTEDTTSEPTEDETGDATEETTGDVLSDVAADGSLVDPLVDVLVGDGSCTTGADGIGDCRFENLTPGTYIVRQVSAPDGMLGAADFEVTIGSGEDLTATVTNVSSIGRVDISLTDGDGGPLAGGEFSLAPAGDVAAGDTLVDEALSTLATDGSGPTGSCTTDAEGACSITVSLPDGPAELVLSQTAAPEGLAPAPPTDLTLAPGETFTFSFTNVAPSGGTITIGLVDDVTDAPLADGRFEVHADDGDGLLRDGDTLVASCATGADGACLYDGAVADAATLGRDGPLAASGTELTVPLGAYVVHQATTLEGYEPADDIAFAFDAPGQVAAITVRNGGIGVAGTSTPPVDFGSAPVFSPAPSGSGPFTMDLDVPEPQVAPTQKAGMGGPTVQQLLQVPADLARLVVRDPLQGLAFIATWLMFAGAAVTVHRRLMLADTLAT